MAANIFGTSRPDFSRYIPVYQNAAIETRYSCVPLDWYRQPSKFSARNKLYIDNALDLLEEAAIKALKHAKLDFSDLSGLVVVSSSGVATPSLDALLIEKLKLRRDMERLPIFGLGCAGGVMGLARTAQLAKAAPDKYYLYLVVELCGLTFLHSDHSKSNIIATALFGDGASAAVISCRGAGPEMIDWGEHTWPNSLDIMGWDVTDNGLKAIFSQDIPSIVRKDMRALVENFLLRSGLDIASIVRFLCHPGGAKVLDAIEEALELKKGDLAHSRQVMKDYGNMSAATVMFVLEAALQEAKSGNHLLSAFGPGFTAALLLMKVP